MPELPEVEVLACELRSRILGLRFTEVKTDRASVFKTEPARLCSEVSGRRIVNVGRRGKFLYFELDSLAKLWVHLGMTGQLFWSKEDPKTSHVHFTARFQNFPERLVFRDARKFGKLFMTFPESHRMPRGIQPLGPEPFDLSGPEFLLLFGKRKGRIKNLLLNQRLLAGLGNIYADECLFRAGIDPRKRPYKISRQKLEKLGPAIWETLKEAIACGGSSIDDYVHTDGAAGKFQDRHRVYGRRGKECLVCGEAICRTVLSGRSSFYCPKCQG